MAGFGLAEARSVLVARNKVLDTQDAVAAQQAQITSTYGHTPVGAGEAAYDVGFPVLYVEKPVFHPGLEFAEGSGAVAGSYPDWAVTVNGWITETIGTRVYWNGAHLVVRIVAPSDDEFVVHHNFVGMAIRRVP